jgi:hypothetical protein
VKLASAARDLTSLALEGAAAADTYGARHLSLEQVERELPAKHGSFSQFPMQDPAWVRGYFADQLDKLTIYGVSRAGNAVGHASFLLHDDWPLTLFLGEFEIAELPLKRLLLLDGSMVLPDDAAAYDVLFAELLQRADFDCIHFEAIPTESFLWNYLRTNERIRRTFIAYEPSAPLHRAILRFNGSFDDYLAKFGAKHRNTIRRKIRKLRESSLGEMRLVRYETVDQVKEFLDLAVAVSRKTYQWRLHQRGLSATDKLRRRFEFAAAHGWMRCYLLYCGDSPRAFLTGYQHEGTFLLDEIGHDPELSQYSPGTVLQYLVVEDLFAHNRPVIWDLQAYGRYKETLSTESYLEGKLLLFKPTFYSRLVISGDRFCRFSSRIASRLLDRWNLKSKVRNAIRRAGWRREE